MANGLWFRVYCEVIDSHKIQALPAEDFKWLINLWALAKLNDGVLPDERKIAFRLRNTLEETRRALAALEAAELLEREQGIAIPHDWEDHQYKTDSSAERARRYRRKQKESESPSRSVTQRHVRVTLHQRDASRSGERDCGVPELELELETNDAPAGAREITSTSMATATPESTPPHLGVVHSPPASPAVGAAAPPDDITPLDSTFLEAALEMDSGTLAPIESKPKRTDGLTDIEAYFRGLPPSTPRTTEDPVEPKPKPRDGVSLLEEYFRNLPPPKPREPEPVVAAPPPLTHTPPPPPPPRKMSAKERERECAENMKRADEGTPPLDQGAIRTMCAALPDLTGVEVAAVAGWKLRNTENVQNPSAFLVRTIRGAYEAVAEVIRDCRAACRDPVEELRGVDGHGRYRMVYPSL